MEQQYPIRSLAAIMFTDMVGYTAMMQQDEHQAMTLRKRHRETLERLHAEHNGKIVQYYGDGSLSIFGSAINAVKCAQALQEELQQEPVVPLRVGVHVGDIAYEENGVFGDGVNTSARIESLAIPGSVLISDKVYDEVKNQPDIRTQSLGYYTLKNVRRQIEIFAVESDGLTMPKPEQLREKTLGATKSVAVLPFVNMSNDPENEYFSDGITEELINALTRIEGLAVKSRTSSFSFKGHNQDIQEIGQQLGVNTLIEGSVRRAGETVRITAQLIDATNGFHIWSEHYDRDLSDIFAVQDEISHNIAQQLKVELAHINPRSKPAGNKQTTSSAKTYTGDKQALNLYLKGSQSTGDELPENARQGIAFLEEAIQLQPDFALPHARLAKAYARLGASCQMPPRQAFDLARHYANRAQELDPGLPDTYVALGRIRFYYDWNHSGAEDAFRAAIELKPSCPDGFQSYAYLCAAKGQLEDATEMIQQAQQFDPLSLEMSVQLARIYLYGQRFEDAIAQCNIILEREANNQHALDLKGLALLFSGDEHGALEFLGQFKAIANNGVLATTHLAYCYARLGRTEMAEQLLAYLESAEAPGTGIALDFDRAIIHTGLGNLETALECLQQCVNQHLGLVLFIGVDPTFEPIRSMAGYPELMERLHLGEVLDKEAG